MKLIKTASGKTNLQISREEWERIGNKQGWITKIAELQTVKYTFDGLVNLPDLNGQIHELQYTANIYFGSEYPDEIDWDLESTGLTEEIVDSIQQKLALENKDIDDVCVEDAHRQYWESKEKAKIK